MTRVDPPFALRPVGLVMLLLILAQASCAVPQPPTGGPRDTTPPSLVASSPVEGAVNVTTQTIRLEFSEYVERNSLPRALTLTPAVEGSVQYDWGRRSVEITLPSTLRDSTTYILSIDTNLQDVRGVSLERPITLAFSTGPTIQQGRLTGRALDARTGDPVADLDVLAYAASDSLPPRPLPERPAYRTQTGPDGSFSFEYLREQLYFVAVLRDRNRNLRPDPGEAYGAPPRAVLRADSTLTDTTNATWLIASPDTLRPTVQQVRSQSSQRHTLRLSEPVRLTSLVTSGWLVVDSLQQQRRNVQAVFQRPGDVQDIVLLTAPLPPSMHLLRPAPMVVDTSGNVVRPDTVRFIPSAQTDTLRARFLRFTPSAASSDSMVTLPPRRQPGVQFSQPVDTARLRSGVTAQDSTGAPRPYEASTPDGTTYRLRFLPPLASAETVRLAVAPALLAPPDTTASLLVQRMSRRQLGSLSGVVQQNGPNSMIIVELYETSADSLVATVAVDPEGAFQFTGLPEGAYRFRAFADRNGNGQWDAGALNPYRQAEPVTWAEAPSWRARWDAALADTLRLPRKP